ncbi:hypothetical protein ACA30_07675 [Virgibacillus soli]|uniref:DUF2269 family protein n=2 Tax=Lederbergia galactosidilytica TaxID=217031 RepID=A0A0Q9XZZ1_9BACI|nr:hypothetical protein ACA29_06295 [Lederbergia galactosidilytica]KRG15254.1 hypothetical protein ACA30_07675 [Virgibacillus soli]OAK68023.1 hypothetical protein ABB05_18285 [Lederbergia galactosidilytica]
MGPGFILSIIPKTAKTMTELRHAYKIKHQLHILVMIGGTLLLVTGLLMGLIHPYLFRMGWYLVSMTLFLIALAMGPFVLKPVSIPVKEIVNHHQGEEIPEEYFRLSKKLDIYENIENLIFLIIITLMILKPF